MLPSSENLIICHVKRNIIKNNLLNHTKNWYFYHKYENCIHCLFNGFSINIQLSFKCLLHKYIVVWIRNERMYTIFFGIFLRFFFPFFFLSLFFLFAIILVIQNNKNNQPSEEYCFFCKLMIKISYDSQSTLRRWAGFEAMSDKGGRLSGRLCMYVRCI